MKRKGFLLALMLVLILAAVQVAAAANSSSTGQPSQPAKVNLFEELNLTDDQIADWQEIKDQAYEDSRELRIQLMDLQHELDLLMVEGDEDAISAKQAEITTVRDKIAEIEKACMEDITALLTEDQQAILEKSGNKGLGSGMSQSQGQGQNQSQGQGPGPGFGGNGQCPNPPTQGNTD